MREFKIFSGMQSALFISALALATTVTGSQVKHWTETPDELLWRGRYKNCDHGYFVYLPPGVVGHGSLPPSSNHGILVSAANPGITTEITLEEQRVIDVYDTNDAAEIGNAPAYLEQYDLKPTGESEKITIIEKEDTKFRGWPAMQVHFRKTSRTSTSEIEELVVYRTPKSIGPLFNVIMLHTTPEFYDHDRALYLQIRDGLHFLAVPRGECSNN